MFPVGLVAGLKFEGPICKDGKVETWQVQYSPKRSVSLCVCARVHVVEPPIKDHMRKAPPLNKGQSLGPFPRTLAANYFFKLSSSGRLKMDCYYRKGIQKSVLSHVLCLAL